MPVEQAGSAAIRVTWTESDYLYDLRWYGALDFIVPVWWLGIVDRKTGNLDHTDVLQPSERGSRRSIPLAWFDCGVGRGSSDCDAGGEPVSTHTPKAS
jgi:hypothetical protein